MRMGKLHKRERHLRKTPPKKYPKYSSAGLIVGQVSSNLYASLYTPHFLATANQLLEDYASDYLDYQDAIKLLEADTLEGDQAELNVDGNVNLLSEAPLPPTPPLFRSQAIIDELSDMMTDASKHFSAPKNEWKVFANAAKFERQLDEKYGILRPFITNHPEVEHFLKSLQRKYAMGYFSPFRQGDPPIPRTTAIIILFMMHRGKVRWEILALGGLFLLVGLQPWALVALVVMANFLLQRRKKKLMGGMTPRMEPVIPYYQRTGGDNGSSTQTAEKDEDEVNRRHAFLLEPLGTQLKEKEALDMSPYDTMILGSGPGTLYTASLLSRTGRTVLVLSPEHDASGCLTFEGCTNATLEKKYRSVPFDVEASNVARIGRQQEILAPALCTSTDYQGGIRFAQIGKEADGYAFEILSIPGMGAESITDEVPFVLRAAGGVKSLMQDVATFLGDAWPTDDGGIGNSLTGAYLQICAGINASAADYFLSKVLPENANKLRSSCTYQETAIRYLSDFLDKLFPLNAHLRSLMAGIGMKSENIQPCRTSMAPHVTNVCAALSGEGMYYPIGGPRALCRALATSVEQYDGKIVTGVQVKELVFEESHRNGDKIAQGGGQTEGELACPRCVGVKLSDGRELRFTNSKLTDSQIRPVVISTHGFIQTFIKLLPEAIRTSYKVPKGLPALTEQRPVFKVLYGLNGSPDELSVTGADFYRLPSAALAIDEIDEATGAVKFGTVGWSVAKNDSEKAEESVIVDDTDTIEKQEKPSKQTRSEMTKYEPESSWMKISFPSAKDPSFALRHGTSVTTCVVTIEADDDFVKLFEAKPKLYSVYKDRMKDTGLRQRLLDRVTKALLEVFPQLEGKIDHSEIRGPFIRGLSHNPERYAAKGIRVDTPYPGLYMGGSDLTVGDSFSAVIVSGWLTANSIMGYSVIDHLYLKKNVLTDLEHFMPLPDHSEEDDVAVPYQPQEPEPAADDEMEKNIDDGDPY